MPKLNQYSVRKVIGLVSITSFLSTSIVISSLPFPLQGDSNHLIYNVAQAQSPSVDNLVAQGINLSDQGEYQAALEALSAAIAQDRNKIVAYLRRAQVHAALDNSYLAIANAQRAAILAQNNEEKALYQEATQYIETISNTAVKEYLFDTPWLILSIEEEQAISFGKDSPFIFWGDTLQIGNSLNLFGLEITSEDASNSVTVGLLESGLIYLGGHGSIRRTETDQSIDLPL